ncbi:SWIB/MDM2 domain-containing protein [Hydrogenophaga sp.]|uniref:SWIB/MDM2 domain-containing protein n=1 Tax=Hydrogenophaga sp. TaxID=1904254 RepID=UPI0019878E4F|nr:SWIB/MDM2 domain-containing protein [Hydrogenophaga sp.]MBD3894039.1 hypothetical protein [Hydrogenophaga sp.]
MATEKKSVPTQKEAAPAKKAAAPAKKAAAPVKALAAVKTAAAPAKKALTPVKEKAAAKSVAPVAPVAKKALASAFMKPMTPSAALAAIVGAAALPRTEVTKQVWAYIKKHKLQDEADRRMINADAKLKVIFEKKQVSMFEMTKLISQHLT